MKSGWIGRCAARTRSVAGRRIPPASRPPSKRNGRQWGNHRRIHTRTGRGEAGSRAGRASEPEPLSSPRRRTGKAHPDVLSCSPAERSRSCHHRQPDRGRLYPGSANLTYPLAGPAVLTQAFSSHHPGVDLAAAAGTAVLAATSGQVSVVEPSRESGGYGNYVCWDCACYPHLLRASVPPCSLCPDRTWKPDSASGGSGRPLTSTCVSSSASASTTGPSTPWPGWISSDPPRGCPRLERLRVAVQPSQLQELPGQA